MLLLVTDTSGKDGFIGLVRAGDKEHVDKLEGIEEVPLAGGTFSAQLVPQISALLEKYGLGKSDIEAFIVITGPGSFTGLRVGLAVIKALAEVLQKPIVAVSLLEVIAHRFFLIAAAEEPASKTLTYAVALDAGRKEAYVGFYKVVVEDDGHHSFVCESESLLSLESLAGLVESSAVHRVVTPDPAMSDFLSDRLSGAKKIAVLKQADRPHSLDIAAVGWKKLKSGHTVLPEHLEVNYIRTAAEIFSKPSSSS